MFEYKIVWSYKWLFLLLRKTLKSLELLKLSELFYLHLLKSWVFKREEQWGSNRINWVRIACFCFSLAERKHKRIALLLLQNLLIYFPPVVSAIITKLNIQKASLYYELNSLFIIQSSWYVPINPKSMQSNCIGHKYS